MSNTTQPNDFNFNTLDNVTFSFQSKLSKLQNVQIIKSREATNKELTWQVWLLSHFISKGHWDPTAPLPIPGNMDLTVFFMLLIDWWFCGVHLEQQTMLYQFVQTSVMITHLLSLLGLSWSCPGLFPARWAGTASPPGKSQTPRPSWDSLGKDIPSVSL